MPFQSARLLCALCLLAIAALGTGCKSASNAFWEKVVGYEKRELLVSDVRKARDAQNDAKEEIKTTMQRFKEVTGFQGGDLEAKYNKLKASYNDSVSRAGKVTSRIGDVEKTAGDLFSEWEKEIGDYKDDPKLRDQSRQQLTDTRSRYRELLAAMRQAESRMKPVLDRFNNAVLSLKHSLNAAAIAGLQGTAVEIEQDVTRLIADMEKSINEANAFINSQVEQKKS